MVEGAVSSLAMFKNAKRSGSVDIFNLCELRCKICSLERDIQKIYEGKQIII